MYIRGTYQRVTNVAVAKDTRGQTDNRAGRVKSQLHGTYQLLNE